MQTLTFLLFRQPGVGILLLNYLLMNTGFFLLIPFIALHGTQNLGLSATTAGLVLGMRQFVQQGLTIFGGAIGDRIGYKPALAIGLLVRAVGFASFAFAQDLPTLLLAAFIAALGGSFFESTGNAALATLATPAYRVAAFSLYGIASRLGSAIGPALGVILFRVDFAVLSLSAASLYIVGFALLFFWLPTITPERPNTPQPMSLRETFMVTWRDRPFVKMVLLNAGYWFLFVQFTISFPLYVYRTFGGLEAVSWYYIFNSIPAILAQYFLLQYLNRIWSRATILVVAMCLIALGIGTVGVWSAAWLVVVSACVYALGDLLYQPTQYTLTSDLARADLLASYFGFAAFALAIGGGSGNILGGLFFDAAIAAGHAEWVWYVYGVVGALIALSLGWWARTSREP